MKKLIPAFLLAAFCSLSALAQQTCCMLPTHGAEFTSDKNFQQAHQNPLPFKFTTENGRMISFPVKGGANASAFYVPAKTNSNKVLLVFHEWWGLNDYIKKEAEDWQAALGDLDVYAIDLYDGKVAVNQEEAAKLMNALQPERALQIINGLLRMIGDNKEIATLGWCMGGSWSFQAAIEAGGQSKACVMYYGFPEKDAKRLEAIQSDILYIQATQDKFITNEAVQQFQDKLHKAGRKITVIPFNAEHAFANPSNPQFNKTFTLEARLKVIEYLKNALIR
ncbi:MAG: dienelactone hydrolase family protein [Bacteroidia bacterium]|nr:dienelactone hydrolase family protein [Bacteroidia bacterium]